MEDKKLIDTTYEGKMPNLKQTKTYQRSDGSIEHIEKTIRFTIIDTKLRNGLTRSPLTKGASNEMQQMQEINTKRK